MKTHRYPIAFAICLAMFSGCADGDAPLATAVDAHRSITRDAHADEHGCEHGETGPHGGRLIELGDSYHAEILHEESAGSIAVYLLDAHGKSPVAAEADQVAINALVNGQATQHLLTAVPQDGDAPNQASRFELRSTTLARVILDDGHAKARLNVRIEGKQFIGLIEPCEDHDHGHEHDPDHGQDHAHDHDHAQSPATKHG
jgi:hypothetical protein